MSSELPAIPSNITVALPSLAFDSQGSSAVPQIVGTPFDWCLCGVLTVQIYIYHLNFPEDKVPVRFLVYGTYLFEVAQTALSTADLCYWFAAGYGNLNHLDFSPWDTPFLCGIIAAVVQCFFAYRIWVLQRDYWWLSALIVLTSMVRTAGAFGAAVRGYEISHFSRFHEDSSFPISFHVWLLGDTISDILIAGSMLYIFHQSKKQDYQHANKVLTRLVRLIVETNTLTGSMVLLSYILYAGFPGNEFYICTTLIMGKLYPNTLLVTFNNQYFGKPRPKGSLQNP